MIITIILTTTVHVQNKTNLFQVNKDERIKVYINSIIQWLEKTNFYIVVIENTGYDYPELQEYKRKYKNRFKILSFKEDENVQAEYLKYDDSKGSGELFSINYAYYNSEIIQKSDFIIKVTGRFYIPDLENYLNSVDLKKYDCLSQNDINRCEMVGCNTKWFHIIFNQYMIDKYNKYDFHVENIYKYRIHTFFKNVLICDKFQIEPTQRGGNSEIYTDI